MVSIFQPHLLQPHLACPDVGGWAGGGVINGPVTGPGKRVFRSMDPEGKPNKPEGPLMSVVKWVFRGD